MLILKLTDFYHNDQNFIKQIKFFIPYLLKCYIFIYKVY